MGEEHLSLGLCSLQRKMNSATTYLKQLEVFFYQPLHGIERPA